MMPDDPTERSAVAAEYVLGTLNASERTEFERALARDPALQKAVYDWQDKLLPMTRMLKPVEPSAGLWARIERGLGARPTPQARPGWWQSVSLWRFGAVTAAAAAMVLAMRLLMPAVGPPPATARYLAILEDPDKKVGWIVEAATGGKLRLVPLVATAVAPQHALQFWTKPQAASGPTSLGLVSPDRITEIDAASLPALERDQLFELTLEPATGSPIDRPTGPILFVGRTVPFN